MTAAPGTGGEAHFFAVAYVTKDGPVARCQYPAESNGDQCYLVAGHDTGTRPTPHNFSNCSWCAYTYEPCPVHEPTAYAEHQAETRRRSDEYRDACDTLRTRADELPDWARDAIWVAVR